MYKGGETPAPPYTPPALGAYVRTFLRLTPAPYEKAQASDVICERAAHPGSELDQKNVVLNVPTFLLFPCIRITAFWLAWPCVGESDRPEANLTVWGPTATLRCCCTRVAALGLGISDAISPQ